MKHESLSALLDGECTPAELDRLLDELGDSPDLMQEWSRQCAAREAREGTRIAVDQACICAGVMARLDEMPEELATPKVVELASRRKPAVFGWKPLAGLAAAASVAAVAVTLSLPARKAAEGGFSAQADLLPQAVTTTPVSLPLLRRGAKLQSVSLRPDEIEQREELNNLLLEHSGSMAEQGMGGTLRYARFAAHTADYRPAAGEQR